MYLKWLCGALTALTLAGMAISANAQSRGRLLFVNSNNGNFQTGGVDVGGYYHAAEANQNNPRLIGTTKLIETDSGILAYALNAGTTTTFLLDSLGSLFNETETKFDSDWFIITGIGNYLFFTNGTGSGAIVYISPNGTIHQTLSSTTLSAWSQVVATDNYLFFYNRTTGAFADGIITADGGTFFQEDGGTGVPTGFTLIASVGDNLLLYNAFTGAYETAGIYFVGNGKDFFDKRSSGTLPLNYAQAVSLDGRLLLYNSTNGATLIGNFSTTGILVVTEKVKKPGWTNVVASGEYLLFYNASSGAYEVDTIGTNGHIAQLSSGNIGAGYDLVTATKQ